MSAIGVLLIVVGVVYLAVPAIPFHLQYIHLENREMSDTGRILYRLSGAVMVLIGLAMAV